MFFKRGQVFVNLITFFLGFVIFIFAAPIVASIINEVVSGFGTATRFVVKSMLWIILFIFISVFLRIIGVGGLFTE